MNSCFSLSIFIQSEESIKPSSYLLEQLTVRLSKYFCLCFYFLEFTENFSIDQNYGYVQYAFAQCQVHYYFFSYFLQMQKLISRSIIYMLGSTNILVFLLKTFIRYICESINDINLLSFSVPSMLVTRKPKALPKTRVLIVINQTDQTAEKGQ